MYFRQENEDQRWECDQASKQVAHRQFSSLGRDFEQSKGPVWSAVTVNRAGEFTQTPPVCVSRSISYFPIPQFFPRPSRFLRYASPPRFGHPPSSCLYTSRRYASSCLGAGFPPSTSVSSRCCPSRPR